MSIVQSSFVLLLIAHLLGDVIFNSERLALLKRAPGPFQQLLGIGFHSAVHALLAGLLLFVGGRMWLKGAVSVLVLHFLIDLFRCNGETKLFGPGRSYVSRSEVAAWISRRQSSEIKRLWPWFVLNILDQTAHLVSLYAVSLFV